MRYLWKEKKHDQRIEGFFLRIVFYNFVKKSLDVRELLFLEILFLCYREDAVVLGNLFNVDKNRYTVSFLRTLRSTLRSIWILFSFILVLSIFHILRLKNTVHMCNCEYSSVLICSTIVLLKKTYAFKKNQNVL